MNMPLNATQIHLLEMFSYSDSEKNLSELKQILSDFYAKKTDNEMDKVWKSKGLTEKSMQEILKSHKRTTYK